MKKRTAVAGITAAALLTAGGIAVAASWDHSKAGTDWAASFPDCDGLIQSPVDVQESLAVPSDKEITINYSDKAEAVALNKGDHVAQAEFQPGAGSITVSENGSDKVYNLLQFHWHTPSENELSGFDSDAEVHFVHQAGDGSLAVVGVLYDASPTGPGEGALNEFFKNIPPVGDRTEIPMTIKLDSIINDVDSAYNFAGSLTTPPCSEGVDWFVVGETDTLSAAQFASLHEVFSGVEFPSGNSRGVQRFVPVEGDDLFEVTLNR